MDFKTLTDRIGLPLETIAERIGRSYGTVLAYRAGVREAPAEILAELRRVAGERAEELERIARG